MAGCSAFSLQKDYIPSTVLWNQARATVEYTADVQRTVEDISAGHVTVGVCLSGCPGSSFIK